MITGPDGCKIRVRDGRLEWSDDKDVEDWEPRVDNTAGDYDLDNGRGEKIESVEWVMGPVHTKIVAKSQWAKYEVQYLGPPFTYGLSLEGYR